MFHVTRLCCLFTIYIYEHYMCQAGFLMGFPVEHRIVRNTF